ncbi:hypothetical protein FGRMN_2493 [Fusarium graminum]|nr:hypothetical protein FGRMN_2493 [Fusarium graminum]
MHRPELTQPEAGLPSPGGRFTSILRKSRSNIALRISELDRYRVNMWDGSWTAAAESRKEHRENKASALPKVTTHTAKTSSLFSRGSSSSSEAPSFGSFLRRKSLDRMDEPISPTVSSSSSKICDATCDDGYDSDRASTSSSDTEHTTVSIARVVDLSSRRRGHILDSSREIPASDNPHLAPSPTLASSPTPLDTGAKRGALRPWPLLQTLSQDSFVSRRTEATITSRTIADTPFLINCGVTIAASPSVKTKNRAPPSNDQSVAKSTDDVPPSNSAQVLPQRPQSSRSLSNSKPRRIPSSTASLRMAASESWKPPDDWFCTPTSPSFQFPDEPDEAPSHFPNELNEAQLSVRQLANESNMVRLLRLTESLSISHPPNDCRDLEVEKMQWMLSAMYGMDGPMYPKVNNIDREYESNDPPKKLLALYETPAVTSYLAAINHRKQIYHLSAAPLSHETFPNIHPILSPIRSPSAFPVAPSTIEAVHSLRLPVAMPSQDIPGLLRNIHRCLEPGGSLYLTIIDPLPIASTLGPLLRTWIENHLVFNLEASFRCTNPSKLLPVWLKNASLRVDPNCIETTQFFAIPHDSSQLQYVRDGHMSEQGLKKELRNTVGRMLWTEIWREYVIAESWWWEDPNILQECMQLQTTWEWRLIEAVKDT